MNKPGEQFELKPGSDIMQLTATVTAVEPQEDAEPKPAELARYRVQLTGAGQISRGWDWDLKVPEATLKRDYAKFNKAGSYVNQMGNHVPSYMQSMQDKVGFFQRAKWNAKTKTVDADLVLARTELAETFKAQLDLDLANNNSMVQFSAVYSYDFSETETKKNGNKHFVITVDKIREVFSVDAVDKGAFPMKPLAALSEWRGNPHKEEEMAKEVETAQETDKGGEVNVATLVAENARRGEEVATLKAEQAVLVERDKAREEAFKRQEAAIAELQTAGRKRENEAHFNAKVATLPADDPGIAALRETIDFAAVDTDGIDTQLAPLVASLTAQGRVEADPQAIKVTQDASDTRKALLTASVLGEEVKEGDKPIEVMPVEKIIGDHFGDVAAGHSPQELWNVLNQAYLRHGLTDAEVDADAMGQSVAKLGDAEVAVTGSEAHAWATQLLQTIVNVARILHDGSEMTGWLNTLIPAMHRVSVPDFNDRYYRYTGTFGRLATVGEGVVVPDVNVSDSFRVPVKPEKKQGKFYLTYEAVMNSPTAALRSLASAMGISISSTDFYTVMNMMFGAVAADGGADLVQTQGYEPAGAFLSTSNKNYETGASLRWTYQRTVNAMDKMYEQNAYGEDQFSLAGMLNPAVVVVPPQNYGAAVAATQAILEPGSEMNNVNRMRDLMIIPIATSALTDVERFFAVVARPRDAQLFVYSTLNGQPPSFQPNVLRDDNAERNRITYKASNIRRINVVDKRAIYVTRGSS